MKINTSELPMIQPGRDSATEKRDPKLLAASRMYEKQFLGEMVKAMRKTVESGGLIEESMGEQIFRESLDNEYVEAWGDKGGVGLGDLIYNQVSERYGIGLAKKIAPLNHGGALPLSNRNLQKIMQRSSSSANGPMQMKVSVGSPNEGGPTQLQTPWAGRLLAQGPLGGGRSFVRVEHDSGLTSEFSFQGHLLDQPPGSPLQAQQTIGLLASPNGTSQFAWTLAPTAALKIL